MNVRWDDGSNIITSSQYAEKMKQSIAESRNHTSRHCITAADVKKP